MKKICISLAAATLCLLLAACGTARPGLLFNPTVNDRTNAVVDIQDIERSTTEITVDAEVTEPRYFEVVAASTTASTTVVKTPDDEPAAIEYYTVKFVDYDGYSTISVQNVAEGSTASEPPMPEKRGDMVFRGWNKDFSNVRQSMIVKAVYQKEWLTVRFLDADGTVLKIEEVLYGNSASDPYVPDKGEYFFDGWDKAFDKVYTDIDVYATYYKIPTRSYTALPDAYKLLSVKENTLEFDEDEYYRNEHNGVCTLGNVDFAGNIIYGNFSDRLDISGFGFTSFEGKLALKAQSENDENTYEIELFVYVDGVRKYYSKLDMTGVYKEFKVDLVGANTLTIRVVPYVNGKVYDYYLGTPEFIGGLIDAVIYEN
ncbi:MAG: InlB B-repeat-containing protein [Clostridia bacterium]|nr:InlB B-repeat-containing protein [Clostridia bacterium]